MSNQMDIWMWVAESAINYIVINQISSANQKQTVTDLKTDLRTTKEDLMAQMKDNLNQIDKEQTEKNG